MARTFARLSAAAAILLAAQAAHAEVWDPSAKRVAPDAVMVTWADPHPVDVYASDAADASITQARLIAHGAHGELRTPARADERPYFLLRDTVDGDVRRIAERLVPLAQGSNFRDVGGYPAADGKHVRWGRIYRSGATPMLTEADLRTIQGLGLGQMVDLRSSEERVLAPTRIFGVPYSAVGYSMATLSGSAPQGGASAASADERGHAVYRNFPTLLAPQLKIVFRSLLADQGAIAYNCSAGQDRTGFVTAMVLSALGVPRREIYADYELSTALRRPAYEMPQIEAARSSENAAAAYFYKAQQRPDHAAPEPLYDAAHRPWLAASFDEIEQRWGSVHAYLEKEVGLDAAARRKLQALYLE